MRTAGLLGVGGWGKDDIQRKRKDMKVMKNEKELL
jgi:hypothetical protein